MNYLQEIVARNRAGDSVGIYSVCTAHPIVLEAVFQQGLIDDKQVLIEATANQVNQYGGYTGKQPEDFIPFVKKIAREVGFSTNKIIFGGDHLGPVVWVDETSNKAMIKARELIVSYVAAGFKKIHLDTSMPCADDSHILTDEIVAARAADLCAVAEKTAIDTFGFSDLVYIIGTEVPPPGGATEDISKLKVTPSKAVIATLETHKKAFHQQGLDSAWHRVIGLVVQPGVEFDHISVYDYVSNDAKDLKALINDLPNIVYEAHSTDYQKPNNYLKLVRDHFAILKVGPQLTYALREALFLLNHIEDELILPEDRSDLRKVCESTMFDNPKYWKKYYLGSKQEQKILRRFSYSDRIRYYWNHPKISHAVEKMLANLSGENLPLPLISQYFPEQYTQIKKGDIAADAYSLIRSKIMQVTSAYSSAC